MVTLIPQGSQDELKKEAKDVLEPFCFLELPLGQNKQEKSGARGLLEPTLNKQR